MFGYLKVYKPELKIKDYETYKAYYCTLCKTLKKRYGLISSFALNYEAAFLSLFIASLSEGSPCFQNKRCTANPFKKCTCIQNTKEPFELASDLTVSLTYYKILDDIEDSSFLKGLALRTVLPFVKLKNKKSIKLRKEVNSTVYEYIKNQSGTEKQNISEIDAAAYPSSFFFRELIKLSGIEPTAEILSFCFFLGRWIYLFDAFDDIPKDKKSGNFNVFLNYGKNMQADEIAQYAFETLNFTLSMLVRELEKIEFKRFKPIIENIIRDNLSGLQDAAREKVRNMNESV